MAQKGERWSFPYHDVGVHSCFFLVSSFFRHKQAMVSHNHAAACLLKVKGKEKFADFFFPYMLPVLFRVLPGEERKEYAPASFLMAEVDPASCVGDPKADAETVFLYVPFDGTVDFFQMEYGSFHCF
jgi:hypothetical protein